MKNVDILKLVKPVVRGLRVYEAKEIPCRVKLDANESPYPFEEDLSKILAELRTNRYPDPEAKDLKRLIAKRYGLSPQNILLGNGSDELIYYLVTTFGGPVLYPVPTFSMYDLISRALGERGVAVPLDREFDIDIEKMLRAVKKENPKVIFLSSPNNPTGNCFSAEKIMMLIERSKGIVVVDEAYQPFASEKGFLPLLRDYGNLVIMRTLSKIGFAALRLGFLLADAGIVAQVNKVRLPFNVNSLSQAIAKEALRDRRGLTASVKTVISERDRVSGEMAGTRGVEPFPSEANFILFRVKDPGRVYSGLLRKGVLIRNLNSGIKGCLRVTIGAPKENTIFLRALKEVMNAKG